MILKKGNVKRLVHYPNQTYSEAQNAEAVAQMIIHEYEFMRR